MTSAAALLQGFHAILAWGRGPHWMLNDADAMAYGRALANAIRHLPVTVGQKYVDFAALAVAVVTYEGPRLAIDRQLRQPGASQEMRRPSGQVFHFHRPPPPGGGSQPGSAASPAAPAPGSQQPSPGPGEAIAPDMTQDVEPA